jgi:hypothetical protein
METLIVYCNIIGVEEEQEHAESCVRTPMYIYLD